MVPGRPSAPSDIAAPSARAVIVLIQPNQRWGGTAYWSLQPYGIASLIASLREQRLPLIFIDANRDDLTIAETVAAAVAAHPAVIGISVLATAYARGALALAVAVRERLPHAAIVLGGVYATTRTEQALQCAAIDYAVIGEGERVFPLLVKALLNGGDPLQNGVAGRQQGQIVIPARPEYVDDLDALPLPDFATVDFARYMHEFRPAVDAPRALPFARLLTSRGCPQGCSFCQVAQIGGRKTRFFSADRVMTEIDLLQRRYGCRAIEFSDDNFLGDRERVLELCRRLRPSGLLWNVMNASPRQLDIEMLTCMAGAGCRYVSLAVESAVPRVQRECVGKPVDLVHTRILIERARALGIDTTALFVIGFPGETMADIRTTVAYARDLGADYVKINVATPLPGTELQAQVLACGASIEEAAGDAVPWGWGGVTTAEFAARELAEIRIREWERINFSTPEKTRKIAAMMRVTEAALADIRRASLRMLET